MAVTSTRCPRCDARGGRVPRATVDALVGAAHRASLGREPFMLCRTPACAVVYFDRDGGSVDKNAVRVRVFHKESHPTRPVCYCFEHSVADALLAARPDGSNAIVDAITAACREGRDRCQSTNPQGRCCLGNLRAVLASERFESCCEGAATHDDGMATPSRAEDTPCTPDATSSSLPDPSPPSAAERPPSRPRHRHAARRAQRRRRRTLHPPATR